MTDYRADNQTVFRWSLVLAVLGVIGGLRGKGWIKEWASATPCCCTLKSASLGRFSPSPNTRTSALRLAFRPRLGCLYAAVGRPLFAVVDRAPRSYGWAPWRPL